MPEDFEPQEVTDAPDFDLVARNALLGLQASQTYNATAKGQRPLGNGGEKTGIAKRDLDESQQKLWSTWPQLEIDVRNRLGEIKAELEDKLTKVDEDSDVGKRYKEQIGNIENKLKQNAFSMTQYKLWLHDYPNEPKLTQMESAEVALGGLAKAAATAQPLFGNPIHTDVNAPPNGVPPNDLHLLSRAVASSKLDEVLGTNVLAEERFGVDPNGSSVGISVGVDGYGAIGNTPDGKSYLLDVDYEGHEVQKGLYDLEALDYITGQIDRHAGNIFIDPTTGKVKGIDNDLAFPEVRRDKMLEDQNNAEIFAKPVHNLPLYMHRETAVKIEKLSPDKLRETLSAVQYPDGSGKLSKKEIEGAVTRLKEMQHHAQELRKQGRVVDTFDKNTYDTAIQTQEDAMKAQFTKTPPMDEFELREARKTSYLGSIEVERQKVQIGIKYNESQMLKGPDIARLTGNTGKIDRSEEFVRYKDKLDHEQQSYKGEVRQNLTHSQLKKLNTLLGELNKYESRLDKLEHPDKLERLRSLRYGGVTRARDTFDEKRIKTLQKIREIDDQMTDDARSLSVASKKHLMSEARDEVRDEQLLKQVQTQTKPQPLDQSMDMARSRSESLSDSQSQDNLSQGLPGKKIDKDKVGDSTVSELESELEVDPPKAKVGVDDSGTQDLGKKPPLQQQPPQTHTQSMPEPKGLEKGGVKKITARFEVLSNTTGANTISTTDSTKPTLERQESVREMMKQSGIVNLTKKNFEVDGGDKDKTVRKSSNIRQEKGSEGVDGPPKEKQSEKEKVNVNKSHGLS